MNKKSSKDKLEKIINNEIQILVGTQLISKGFHFPNLNCNPLFTALIGFFILKQKVSYIHWLGIIICMIGVGLISDRKSVV